MTDHTPIVVKGLVALGLALMIIAIWKDLVRVGF